MQLASVASAGDVLEIEARLVGARLAELGRDEDVFARLVPEVVVHGRRAPAVLQRPGHLERRPVDAGEASGGAAVAVAEHRDDDVGHAVHRVRPG